uniref:Uncharacterized protein n=1 Tax=Arundo donax TaxID=35708 RepID=A0A0A8ZTG8_ARUDO
MSRFRCYRLVPCPVHNFSALGISSNLCTS